MKPAIPAKTDKIEGLETWLPKNRSTMVLCERETGPFVSIEDYQKLRGDGVFPDPEIRDMNAIVTAFSRLDSAGKQWVLARLNG